jgi:sugar phosphate isomerase/epimerase
MIPGHEWFKLETRTFDVTEHLVYGSVVGVRTFMDIICASICYRGYAENEVYATLEYSRRIGYRWMEIHGPMAWSVQAIRAFDLPDMQARITASGLRCAGIYSPGWGGKDDSDVAAHACAIAQAARMVEALGGHHVASTGALPRTEAGALDRVVACVGQVLAQVPASCPVKLALEPHYGNVLQQPEDFERVLDAFPDPRLGLCVDTGHFHSAGVDTRAFIRKHAARIYNVHLKDHIKTVSVGVGRGEIDLKAIVETLCDVGYAGDLTVELEVEDPQNLPRYTEEAYLYLSGLLGRKL